jgi:hypothetical protein
MALTFDPCKPLETGVCGRGSELTPCGPMFAWMILRSRGMDNNKRIAGGFRGCMKFWLLKVSQSSPGSDLRSVDPFHVRDVLNFGDHDGQNHFFECWVDVEIRGLEW